MIEFITFSSQCTRCGFTRSLSLDRNIKGYNNWKSSRNMSDRQRLIYVGANDSMLHAFDYKTGIEKWAFVPPFLIPKLPLMINKNLNLAAPKGGGEFLLHSAKVWKRVFGNAKIHGGRLLRDARVRVVGCQDGRLAGGIATRLAFVRRACEIVVPRIRRD